VSRLFRCVILPAAEWRSWSSNHLIHSSCPALPSIQVRLNEPSWAGGILKQFFLSYIPLVRYVVFKDAAPIILPLHFLREAVDLPMREAPILDWLAITLPPLAVLGLVL